MTRSLSDRESETYFFSERLLEKVIVSRMFRSIIYQNKEDYLYKFDFFPKAA